MSGTDRITRTVNDVVNNHGTDLRRSRTYVWTTDSQDSSLLVSTREASVDGSQSWSTSLGLVSSSQRLCGGNCYATNTAPDGSYAVTLSQNGRVQSATRYDSNGAQLSQTTVTYDAHGRQIAQTDARTGTTTNTYNNADQIVSVTTPVPGAGLNAQTTSYSFDTMGRAWKVTQPDGSSVTNEYFLTGELKKTYGSRTYPVEYSFDYASRMLTMKTWQNFASASGAAVTTWNYDSQRGFMTSKRYADNQGPNYTYNAAGKLLTRTWARGITTTYVYNNAGELSTNSYSGTVTPAVVQTYDRRGRVTTVTQGTNTTTRAYNDAGQVLGESYTAGLLNGMNVTNNYDGLLRRTNMTLKSGSSTLATTGYGFDAASRLATVGDGTNAASYSYLANSRLVDNIVFKQNATTRMTTTNTFDNLNRLTSIASTPASFAYQYNDANQRVQVTQADGSYWIYQYDALGQVTNGKKYWNDNSAVAGQQFEYGFDDIGNRKTTKAGGNAAGRTLRQASYSANALNQYTARTVPGFVDIMGSAITNATVTVNLQPASRKDMFFRKELALNNSVGPVYQSVTNVAVLVNGTNNNIVVTNIGSAFLPQTPEAYTYDPDGNLLSDGRWTYTWDAENSLIRVVSATPAGPQQRIDYAYDHQGRRISKKAWNNTAGTGTPAMDVRYVWDGWNLIAILDPQSSILTSFMWGLDLSGSLHGTGGVGGLLAENATTNGVHFAAMDGNGNVAALVSANDGTVSATYEYGPFGEVIRATGPACKTNPFRFSTKFQDDETGLLYYGYRYYEPSTGRWINRDPLGVHAGANECLFLRNNPITSIDIVGLCGACCCCVQNVSISGPKRDYKQPIRRRFNTDISGYYHLDYDFVTTMAYRPSAATSNTGCTMEWVETWFNVIGAEPWYASGNFVEGRPYDRSSSRANAFKHKAGCPDVVTVLMHDAPGFNQTDVGDPPKQFALYISFTVRSGTDPRCNCPNSQKGVNLLIKMRINGGAADLNYETFIVF